MMWASKMPSVVRVQGERRLKRQKSKKCQYDGKQCFIQRPRLRTIPEEEMDKQFHIAYQISLDNNYNITKKHRSKSMSNIYSKSKVPDKQPNQHSYVWKGNNASKTKTAKNVSKEEPINKEKSRLKKMIRFLTVPREDFFS